MEDTWFEKQEQEQVSRLLTSIPQASIEAQTDRLQKLYQESMPYSNLEAVRQLDVYQQLLSVFRQNNSSGWAILFMEIGKKNSRNNANAGSLLRDLAMPRYQFILDELKAEDIVATELILVRRLLRLETFGGQLKDPSK